MDLATHYDLLIDENNDPFRDPPMMSVSKVVETEKAYIIVSKK